jgi:23S rRNA (pseudouridine1915-N3)-methyltransferase
VKIRLITIGKVKSGPHQAIAADYIERLGHYLPFELMVLKKEEDVLKKIGPDDFLIVCGERGREMISAEFAEFIEERQIRSTKYLTFVVGPAEGLSDSLKRKADIKLSMSRFTMQHDLAALVLLEQLYRACTIIRGEPYHK